VDVRLLGPLEVRLEDGPVDLGPRKQRAVLAMLALEPARTVPADRLAEGLWGDRLPPSAAKMVQLYVSRLRRVLDGDAARMVTRDRGYELQLADDEVDAVRAERLIEESRPREALALWRGEPLEDLAGEPFAAPEIRRLEELRLRAAELAVSADLAAGRHDELIAELDALVAANPLRERLHAQRMLALYRANRQSEALAAYRAARADLVEQIGVEPGAPLQRLHEQILAHDPALELPPHREALPRHDASLTGRIGESSPQGHSRATAPALPAQLTPRPAMPFVGRSAELGRLAALPDRARTDGRQIALVGGEPGSGKTRLARELAEHATAAGVPVLYGACDPAVRTPYQPFLEALEPAVAGLDHDEPSGARYPASLTRLLPALRARAGDGTTAVGDTEPGNPEAERHELHVALTGLLARVAQHSPAVLVLDDMQWADTSSLILLRHIARTLGATPIVVVALFREGDGELPTALASTLAELHRLDGVVRVRLGGLGVMDVQELVDRSDESMRGANAGLAQHLVGLTDGNAFLVGEVWRHMLDQEAVASRADAMIPDSVREVMADRVAGLTPSLGELLQLIAVSPRGIAFPVLRVAAGMDDEVLPGVLDEGLQAGMLEEIRDASLVYRVRHELLRRTVYERLSTLRAAALHVRVGEALEAVPEGRREQIVNELAFHFRAAAPVAGNGRALDYALEAAAQAERSLAFAEAAARFDEALALGVLDRAAEGEVRVRQGRAWHLAARPRDALESFAAAAAAARECGDDALLARTAIGFETACWRPGIDDPRAVALLREAAGAMAAEPSAQRVRVLAHLSRALAYRREHAAAGRCWSEAVAMARLVGDPGALMVALSHAAWTRGSRALDEILADLAEAGELARTLPYDFLSDVVKGMRVALLIEAFAIDEARAENAAIRELAERAGQPFLAEDVAQQDSLLALCDGRLDAAEAAATRVDEIAREIQGHPSVVYGIQMFSIRREQGRLAEVAPAVRLVASGETDADSVWRPALAVLLAEIGDVEAARRELRALVDADLGTIVQGGLGLGGLTYVADACALIEDAALAAPIYEQLLAFEGQNVVLGSAVACYGAVDRMLGALATVMRRWDEAERHLGNALVLNRRLAAPTWIAHTLYERARLACRREPPLPSGMAPEQVSEALDAARRIGLPALVARIERLTASLPAPAADDRRRPVQ